jgi:hypothetical protein
MQYVTPKQCALKAYKITVEKLRNANVTHFLLCARGTNDAVRFGEHAERGFASGHVP